MAKKQSKDVASSKLIPSSQEQAFLQSIRDNHLQPKHYREFAKWLKSQGDNRAAAVLQGIIRRELMWKLPDTISIFSEPELQVIDDEHNAYRHENWKTWREKLPSVKGIKFGLFDGGLVDQVHVPKDLSVFAEHAAHIFATTAVVELIPPYNAKVDFLKQLFEIPEVATMKTLVIGDEHQSKVARAIAESPQLNGIQTLLLRNNRLKDSDAKLLAESKHLGEVKMLSLSNNRDITSVGIEEIGNSPTFKNLTTLILNSNDFESDGGEFIAKAKYLKRLRWLDLAHCNISDRGVHAMVESGKLDKLETFDVQGNDLSAESLEHFLLNSGSKLKSFSCSYPHSDECDIKVFHKAALPKLNQLILMKLSDASLLSLAKSEMLKQLGKLKVWRSSGDTGFSPSATAKFAKADFASLRMLSFDMLDEPSIISLAKNPTLKKLKSLSFLLRNII